MDWSIRTILRRRGRPSGLRSTGDTLSFFCLAGICLFDDFMRDAKGIDSGGDATINRHLEENLPDFVGSDAVAQRARDVFFSSFGRFRTPSIARLSMLACFA